MKTFQLIYEEAQESIQDSSADTLALLKSWINVGQRKFSAKVRRNWYDTEKTFDTVADQLYYQLPEDSIRPKSIVITIGEIEYPLEWIENETEWRRLTQFPQSGDIPESTWLKGRDQFAIYPTPVTSNDDAGLLTYHRRLRRMTQADYTTGTITLTNGSATVTGSGTTFTAKMVGRTLLVEDAGSDDFIGYKVAGFAGTTSLTLENAYGGSTGAGLTYRIGEVPDIPDEYHESVVDYAMYRYYLRRKDRGMAKDMFALYDTALKECEAEYSSVTTSNYSRANLRKRRRLGAFNRDAGLVTGA